MIWSPAFFLSRVQDCGVLSRSSRGLSPHSSVPDLWCSQGRKGRKDGVRRRMVGGRGGQELFKDEQYLRDSVFLRYSKIDMLVHGSVSCYKALVCFILEIEHPFPLPWKSDNCDLGSQRLLNSWSRTWILLPTCQFLAFWDHCLPWSIPSSFVPITCASFQTYKKEKICIVGCQHAPTHSLSPAVWIGNFPFTIYPLQQLLLCVTDVLLTQWSQKCWVNYKHFAHP